MRIISDIKTIKDGVGSIIQTTQTPVLGASLSINGQVVIPCPPNVKVPLTNNDYILPIDGGDVSSKIFARLLLQYPSYRHIYFNPLLSSEHLNDIDYEGSFFDRAVTPNLEYQPRFQAGRSSDEGGDDASLPCYTAILAQNDKVSPARPGLMISKDIDISSYVLDCNSEPSGSDNFMLYWKLFKMETSHDVMDSNTNSPAIKSIIECDQEPIDFSVYLSTDSGGSWSRARNLESLSFCDKKKTFKVAFVNHTDTKYYLAVLFN
jgi:hypothetical protein